MSALRALLAARAAAAGRAQRITQLRHRHLAAMPLVLVPYQMAGEEHSMFACAVGTQRDHPRIIVVGEPRNRDLLYAGFRELSDVVFGYITPLTDDREVFHHTPRGRAPRDEECCRDAPQIVLPNKAALELLGRWGRLLRYHDEPELSQLGMLFTFVRQRANIPGQSTVVVLTDLLRKHWVTGQSELEDENLATLDAWIDPPGDVGGRDAAAAAEASVVMGPLTSPRDDDVLAKVNAAFNAARRAEKPEEAATHLGRIRQLLEERLTPAWTVAWRCLERECGFTPAASIAERWLADRRAFTRHVDYVARGGRFRARDTARMAAERRMDMERALAETTAQECCDDPVMMAEQELAARAMTGTIVAVDLAHLEQGPRRKVSRPLLTLALRELRVFPEGKELHWAENPTKVHAVIQHVEPSNDQTLVTLMVTGGMQGQLPKAGDVACFSEFTPGWSPRLQLPWEAPWTHVAEVQTERPIDAEWPAEAAS